MGRTDEKAINQKGKFLTNVLGTLIRVGLPLMIPFGLTAAVSTTDTAIQKQLWVWPWLYWYFKQRNERYHGNSYISWRIWFIE